MPGWGRESPCGIDDSCDVTFGAMLGALEADGVQDPLAMLFGSGRARDRRTSRAGYPVSSFSLSWTVHHLRNTCSANALKGSSMFSFHFFA